ncbi:hypothetical protein RclHR1_22130001 [Rhizophagus clarus]|uniref:Uncharacterized protein n=1 Tax=Rhizophagus clarus TaxID=94130 RepID=A0A2Z6QUN6_9GLOM|nr:hypothetical protein RclHR1_22130001 [Rhizophagus clarus]GES93183.1 hypothetical protein RCL_e8879_RclHR1_22130001 [Rhizophagus clarus]
MEIERAVVQRNVELTRDLGILDNNRPNYQNHYENCETLLNSKRENWMLFSYPPPYDQWYRLSDVLTCKTCFRELADKYFGDIEMQYLEILKETTEMKMPQDEHSTLAI